MAGGQNAHFKCFLGNLGQSVDEDSLTKSLEHIESFAGVKVMYDKFDGKPRGFGWAWFNDMAGMKAATALSNRILIHGRAVLIQPPREGPGAPDEEGRGPQRKRKVHKPIQGPIEIAHAHLAEIDKQAYQSAISTQKRQRQVAEPLVDMHRDLLLPQTKPGQPGDGPDERPKGQKAGGLPVKLLVKSKAGGGQEGVVQVGGERGGASGGAHVPSSAPPSQTGASKPEPASGMALLQAYGDSDDESDA